METYDPHKSATEVRQGSRRLDNFRVLILSVVAIVVIFGVIFMVSVFSNTPPSAISP